MKNTNYDMIVDIYILQAIDVFWPSHATVLPKDVIEIQIG